MSKNIAFLTLGCAKNEVDSSKMQENLIKAGYRIVDLDEPYDALVINSCAFIQSAIEESIDAILDAAGLEDMISGQTKLVVAGCLPARFGHDLEAELTEVDRFVPCADETNIVSIMNELLGASKQATRDVQFSYEPSEYVKISDGCSRRCAFCAIPLIRGPHHSFSFDTIYSDVRSKIEGGAREIVLIAQDTGIWGLDLDPKDNLASLMNRLADEFQDTWFRVMYLEPAGISDELLTVMKSHPNICNYLDIPLQHVDPDILKSMNRQGSRQEFERLLEHIRNTIPDITLRTTLIVGYPGETDEQFDELCDFVSESEFDYVGVFSYSREEGTPAALLPDQIDEEVKQDRLQEIRDIADAVSSQRIARRIGWNTDVLILGREEDGQLFGRCQCQAPDVDGVTYLEDGEIGQFVPCTISDTLLYEMEATRD